MRIESLTPMLWTSELQKTVDFYTKTLGFICGEINESWGWAALQKDEIEIMFAVPNERTTYSGPSFTGSLYMVTDDVDAIWEDLKDRVKIAYPIENFEHKMREFAIYDNNGYMLQFGQDMIDYIAASN